VVDNDVHAERSLAKNKGGDTGDLTPKRRPDNLMPKRRPNGSITLKERKFMISSSSLYRLKLQYSKRKGRNTRRKGQVDQNSSRLPAQ
jgi:hypothetical protein